MSAAPITAPVAACRIVGSREVRQAPTPLPRQRLGLGPFTLDPLDPIGPEVVQLRDASGEPCGVFVNKQLAAATAAHLES